MHMHVRAPEEGQSTEAEVKEFDFFDYSVKVLSMKKQ